MINLLQTTYVNPGIVSAESSLCATIHWGSAWVFLICSHTFKYILHYKTPEALLHWNTTGADVLTHIHSNTFYIIKHRRLNYIKPSTLNPRGTSTDTHPKTFNIIKHRRLCSSVWYIFYISWYIVGTCLVNFWYILVYFEYILIYIYTDTWKLSPIPGRFHWKPRFSLIPGWSHWYLEALTDTGV